MTADTVWDPNRCDVSLSCCVTIHVGRPGSCQDRVSSAPVNNKASADDDQILPTHRIVRNRIDPLPFSSHTSWLEIKVVPSMKHYQKLVLRAALGILPARYAK